MAVEYGAHQGRNADVVEESGVQRSLSGAPRPIGGGNLCGPGSRALSEPIGDNRGSLLVNMQVRGGKRVVSSLPSSRVAATAPREKFPRTGGVRGPTSEVDHPALFRRIYARTPRSLPRKTDR